MMMSERYSVSSMWLVVIAVWCVMVHEAMGAKVSWTGYGKDGQWTNPMNWGTDQVPTMDDDVTIEKGAVIASEDAEAKSVTLGTSGGAGANLTVYRPLYVGGGGMSVMGSGSLFVSSGVAGVDGKVVVVGRVVVSSGWIGGKWSIEEGGVSDFSGAAEKQLQACNLDVKGVLMVSGTMTLRNSSRVSVASVARVSGPTDIRGDKSGVAVDASGGGLVYYGGGTLLVEVPMVLGRLIIDDGNVSVMSETTVASSVVVPGGSRLESGGVARVTLAGGVSGSGDIVALGKKMVIGGSQFDGLVVGAAGIMSVSGNGSSFGSVVLSGGELRGVQVAIRRLSVSGGALVGSAEADVVRLSTTGFRLDGPLWVRRELVTSGTTLVVLDSRGTVQIEGGATMKIEGPTTITGEAGRWVENHGTMVVRAPLTLQNVDLTGRGNCTVGAAMLMETASIEQLAVYLTDSGALNGRGGSISGIASIIGKPYVRAIIGEYSLECGEECRSVHAVGKPSVDFAFHADNRNEVRLR